MESNQWDKLNPAPRTKAALSLDHLTTTEEHVSFFVNHNDTDDKQQPGLYNFTIGVGGKYLVEKIRCHVQHNRYEDVAIRLVVQPVHYENQSKQTNNEAKVVQQTLNHQIGVKVAFDERERSMPHSPYDGKNQAGIE